MTETRARGIRIDIEDIDRIMKRARRRGISFNAWVNWAVKQGLRSHRKEIK